MPNTLAIWHADHLNFAKLLNLLEEQLGLFREGESPDYQLMLDIMYYMTHYPDVFHHPKEDLVFARIKERESPAVATIDKLTKQHAALKACGEKLVHDLDDIVNGSIVERERIETSALEYLANFRDHMRIEEIDIIPLAARLLRDRDWSAIDAAIRHIEDPLFGRKMDERYAAIAQQIERNSKGASALTR
jgi:hemerythrin-like domain-containing protein